MKITRGLPTMVTTQFTTRSVAAGIRTQPSACEASALTHCATAAVPMTLKLVSFYNVWSISCDVYSILNHVQYLNALPV